MTNGALAVIIGRSGSRGLPGKNAREVGGQPMIAHSIRHARAARCVKRVALSTNDPCLAAVAAAEGVEVVDRPARLASERATVADVVRHATARLGGEHGIIVILYANVPVRPCGLIDRAVDRLAGTGADSVQSYCDVGKHHPWWMVELDDAGRVRAHVENSVDRRQDLPPLLIPDGGVIAVTRASLFRPGSGSPHDFLGRDRRGIRTEPGDVVDVDREVDLLLADAILRRESIVDAPA